MFYDVSTKPLEIDIHVQMVDVAVAEDHIVHIKASNKQTGHELFNGSQTFNMDKEAQTPKGYEGVKNGIVEIAMPFTMERAEIKDVNTLNIEVTIEGNKQNVQLFLAGEVDG